MHGRLSPSLTFTIQPFALSHVNLDQSLMLKKQSPVENGTNPEREERTESFEKGQKPKKNKNTKRNRGNKSSAMQSGRTVKCTVDGGQLVGSLHGQVHILKHAGTRANDGTHEGGLREPFELPRTTNIIPFALCRKRGRKIAR